MVRNTEPYVVIFGLAESILLRCGLMLVSRDSVRSHPRFHKVYLEFAFQLNTCVSYVRVAVFSDPTEICIYIGWCLLQVIISFRLTVIRLSQTRLNHNRLNHIRLNYENISNSRSWYGVNCVPNSSSGL